MSEWNSHLHIKQSGEVRQLKHYQANSKFSDIFFVFFWDCCWTKSASTSPMLQRHNAREANGQFLFKIQLPEEKTNVHLRSPTQCFMALGHKNWNNHFLCPTSCPCTFFSCFFSNPHGLLCVPLYMPTLETWSKASLSAQGPTSSSACLILHNLLFDKAIPSHLSYHCSVRCYEYSDQVFFKVQTYIPC